jgi:large subunit ribosomal protein L5
MAKKQTEKKKPEAVKEPKGGARKGATQGAAPPEGRKAKAGGPGVSGERYVPRLQQRYKEEIVPRLMSEFGIGNPMAVPRLEKISLNMGLGEASRNIKVLDDALVEMTALAGQRPTMTRAKKSIAAFKLREGMPIGARVTLRGDRMWDFLDRLISVALPRVRDFRGVSRKSFDGRGSYTLGIRDHLIFPEVDYNKVDVTKGMNVTIVTTAGTDEQALFLLRELGMPFAAR